MRASEIACVKVAVKRVIISNNIQVGYKFINEWHKRNKYNNKEFVIKCFEKWIKHRNIKGDKK